MGGGREGPWRAASDSRQDCRGSQGGRELDPRRPKMPGSPALAPGQSSPDVRPLIFAANLLGWEEGQECIRGAYCVLCLMWRRRAPALGGRGAGEASLQQSLGSLLRGWPALWLGFGVRQTPFQSCCRAAQPLSFGFLTCKVGAMALPLWLCYDSKWGQFVPGKQPPSVIGDVPSPQRPATSAGCPARSTSCSRCPPGLQLSPPPPTFPAAPQLCSGSAQPLLASPS